METNNLDFIRQGDCIQLMKELDDESVDCIITDPPYGIAYTSCWHRTKTERFDVLKNDDNDVRFQAFSEFHRILKNNSVCVVFASWKNMHKDIVELKKLFEVKNVIIWWKRKGGIGDLKYSLATDYEVAIVCHKGKCRIRGKRDGSVWECTSVNPVKMVHPTQKPEQLIERLINKFSDEGDVVLDAFMGSGTTAIACMNTNRHYIGYELDEKYFNIAQERISQYGREY